MVRNREHPAGVCVQQACCRGFSLVLLLLLLSSVAAASSKQQFIDLLLPLAQQQNAAISAQRQQLQALQARLQSAQGLSAAEKECLLHVAHYYKLKNFQWTAEEDWHELLTRVDVIPNSLLLAQAANESAWGTSRFAVEGNNFFGQWCYQAGCGIVPQQRAAQQRHEVQKFAHPEASVASYLRNLNTHQAYRSLRVLRAELRKQSATIRGSDLVAGLKSYSQKGKEYVRLIEQLLQQNNLLQYDD